MDSKYKQRLSSSPKKTTNSPGYVKPQTSSYSDRHIPSSTPRKLRESFSLLSSSSGKSSPASFEGCSHSTYKQILQNELLGIDSPRIVGPASSNFLSEPSALSTTPPRLFTYASRQRELDDSLYSLSPMGLRSQAILSSPKKAPRKIPKVPIKVLEAPSIQDDFYLNLVDWSSLNQLAVGLHQSVYLWNASSSMVTKLCDLEGCAQVASVSWMGRGTHLAIGSTEGGIGLWDVTKQKLVRSFPGHKGRVGTLAWSNSPRWLLSSGSRDRSILHHDVRSPARVGKMIFHKQEVCGLKWGYDPSDYLASGGNDNKLLIWDMRLLSSRSRGSDDVVTQPVNHFTSHRAAVKAITWSPHQRGILASGGGTADQCIRFWNTSAGQELHHIDTGSQVCNLAWSKNVNELVSTHGYSQNHISVWHYPSMSEVVTLTGHSMRVLYLAVSPDGQTIVTGAGDETLRFWSLFPPAPSLPGSQSFLQPRFNEIR